MKIYNSLPNGPRGSATVWRAFPVYEYSGNKGFTLQKKNMFNNKT